MRPVSEAEIDAAAEDAATMALRDLMETVTRGLGRARPDIGFALVVLEPYPPTGPSGRVQVSSNMEPSHLADALAVLCHRIDAGAATMEPPPSGSRH